MTDGRQIYDFRSALEMSLSGLVEIFALSGASRVFFKRLAPNDNSKNQVYLAGHFTDLGFIPTGDLVASDSTSGKIRDAKRKIKFTADLRYCWISSEGAIYPSPRAKLIYYPQFPEVRLSGFVAGCKFDMAGWMDPAKRGREQGRVLFFGIRGDGTILAYLAVPGSRISQEIGDVEILEISSVLGELPLQLSSPLKLHRGVAESPGIYATGDLFSVPTKPPLRAHGAKQLLLEELRRIHLKGPIPGQRLTKRNKRIQYAAQNGGGYTLEAELGIVPNGYAEPDFHGWEVKQFGVKRCDLINSKALTVMTPEPNGGYYAEQGVDAFIRKYGYKSPNDRLDFTGRHFMGSHCEKSGLTLVAQGFDSETGKMADALGFIGLLDEHDNVASSWAFAKLLEHWKKKHAKAVYIPSVAKLVMSGPRTYFYCNVIRLFQGTDFERLLRAFDQQAVYYDPGINMKFASTKPVVKRRSQFRIKSSSLKLLYEQEEVVDVLDVAL